MEQRYRVLPGGEEHEELWIGSRAALEEPARVSLPPPAPAAGLLLPDGGVNWACPCLGGMATGPCGTQFRDAFSCFHYSTADPKGSDCYEKFSTMQECMAEFPTLYGRDDDDDLAAAMGGEGEEAEAPAGRSAGSASSQPDGDAK